MLFQILSVSYQRRHNIQRFFSHLLLTISAHSALFEKYVTVFSVKTFKTTCSLGKSSIPNTLDLQKLGGKVVMVPFYWTFVPFFRYTASIPLFSRKSPDIEDAYLNLRWIEQSHLQFHVKTKLEFK